MKVRLAKPTPRAAVSVLVVQTRLYHQLRFVNADPTVQIVSSAAYRQTFSVWQKERGN